MARLAVVGLADQPGIAFKIFSLLAKENVNVDIILQSIGRHNTKDISFTVGKQDMERTKKLLEDHVELLGFDHIDVSDQIAKISIVGAGMVHNPGVAAKMFEALYNAGININMISTSEIKVSVLVDLADADPGGPGHPRPLLQRIRDGKLNGFQRGGPRGTDHFQSA